MQTLRALWAASRGEREGKEEDHDMGTQSGKEKEKSRVRHKSIEQNRERTQEE